MIKVKDGYAKLIGTTYQGSATQVLLSNGGDLEYSASSKASTLVQRNASQHIYATYFNSAISDEALTDIGSVYVRNTSDTFIRRVSKTQFYSILDDKFVTLDTTQSITGAKTFSTSVRFANNASIIQNQNDTSNYTTILKWYKNGASRNTYDPSIGQHNTGGDGNGSICILPYPTETSPWGGMVGLFISKGVLKLDGKSVALAENYYTKTESDERYVNVTGDTMTGPLIVKAAITGTQLISTIATGTSPLKVTSTTVVTNLNSDLLDGLHETSFFRARGDQSIASSVPTTTELATSNNLCGSWNVKYTGASGHLVQFNAGSGSTRYMQFYSMYSGSLYWRNSTDSTLNTKSWKTIVDSANYTGIVLKIGTATKGSATLPIYLNAGTPTACSTTLGVSITGNAATATKLQTARTINGTSFDGTANIVTAYWGTARTISLSGAVTGSASVNGSQNVTITTTYQFGSIDGRYVGGNKTANHGSSGTAYTADTYSSTFVNKAFVAFAERGSWAYANNGYVSTDTGVNIPLAGTAIFQWGASDTNKTQLYITPHNNSGVSNPAANEMLFYTSNGSGYTSAWTRVLTHRNYTNYTVTKTGGGASGTWGISITGNAATANRILSHTISDTLANKTTPGYLYHAGGSNSVADKPSGVDAFGVFTMQTASGWYGQILMSSNTSTGLYWRTATTLSGGWKKILDSSNYTAYINPANFVTALGTSGNYLTWTKNGVVNNLTVPYATASSRINSSSSVQNTGLTYYSSGGFVVGGTAAGGQWGMPSDSQDAAYKNGQCLRMYWGSTYYTDILSGPNNMGTTHGLYMRQIVNGAVATGTFAGGWRLILDSYNYHRYGDTRYVTSLGTNGTYVTWVKNGTTNNLTVPYSSYSGYLQSHDTRSTNNTPAQFSSGARFEFKYNSTDGLSNGGTYHGILHFKPYGGTTDFSGGQTHQLGFTDGGNLYMRTSTSSSAWGSWKLILTQTTADGRYVTSLGTNGNYLTWTKAGTTNNITVPYATNSNKANYIYYGSISNLNSPSSWTSDGYRLVYDTYSGSASNKPVSQDNANGIITLFKSKHGTSNQYVSQLAFPNNTRMYFRYASAGSFSSWYTIAYTSDIKDPANYYWANVKVSASSNSGTSPTFSTAYTSNWFRSTGSTGWYSESYGGGWHMSDSTWLRAYNGKAVYTSNAGSQAFNATGGFYSGGSGGNGLTIIGSESTTTRIKGQIGSSVNTAVARYEVQWYSNYARFDVHRGGSTDISKWSFKYNSTEVTYLTTGGHLYVNGFHHRSMDSNNYVLLAGGSYKSLADFTKGNAGASNRGVYVTNGTVTAMTYYLNATVNSGASSKLAYYSGTNSIDDYTSTVGSSTTPMYLSGGVPTVCGGVVIKYWAIYTINSINSTVTFTRDAGNYSFLTSITRMRDNGNGAYCVYCSYPSGYSWSNTIIWGSGSHASEKASYPEINGSLYVSTSSGGSNYFYVRTADDASTNNGKFRLFMIWF